MLANNACSAGVGVVILRVHCKDGKEKLTAFASRALSKAERNNSLRERVGVVREGGLSIIWKVISVMGCVCGGNKLHLDHKLLLEILYLKADTIPF